MTPGERARLQIDAMLIASGRPIQEYKALNPGAKQGIVIRKVALSSGRCDYLLFVDRVPMGVFDPAYNTSTWKISVKTACRCNLSRNNAVRSLRRSDACRFSSNQKLWSPPACDATRLRSLSFNEHFLEHRTNRIK